MPGNTQERQRYRFPTKRVCSGLARQVDKLFDGVEEEVVEWQYVFIREGAGVV